MKTKIQKWGNSLGVRIPKSLVDEKLLREGTGVLVRAQGRNIVIEPIENEAATLEQLVAAITPSNRHDETGWGQPTGNEVW